LGVVTEIFLLEGAKVFDRGLFKSSLNISCKLHVDTFVPFCRWRFHRYTAIFSQTRYFPYLCN